MTPRSSYLKKVLKDYFGEDIGFKVGGYLLDHPCCTLRNLCRSLNKEYSTSFLIHCLQVLLFSNTVYSISDEDYQFHRLQRGQSKKSTSEAAISDEDPLANVFISGEEHYEIDEGNLLLRSKIGKIIEVVSEQWGYVASRLVIILLTYGHLSSANLYNFVTIDIKVLVDQISTSDGDVSSILSSYYGEIKGSGTTTTTTGGGGGGMVDDNNDVRKRRRYFNETFEEILTNIIENQRVGEVEKTDNEISNFQSSLTNKELPMDKFRILFLTLFQAMTAQGILFQVFPRDDKLQHSMKQKQQQRKNLSNIIIETETKDDAVVVDNNNNDDDEYHQRQHQQQHMFDHNNDEILSNDLNIIVDHDCWTVNLQKLQDILHNQKIIDYIRQRTNPKGGRVVETILNNFCEKNYSNFYQQQQQQKFLHSFQFKKLFNIINRKESSFSSSFYLEVEKLSELNPVKKIKRRPHAILENDDIQVHDTGPTFGTAMTFVGTTTATKENNLHLSGNDTFIEIRTKKNQQQINNNNNNIDPSDSFTEASLQSYLDLLTMMGFLSRENLASQVYHINLDKIQTALKNFQLETYIESRFGPICARIYRILFGKKFAEEKQVSECAMISQMECRGHLYILLQAGLVQIQEVPLTFDHNPQRTYFLWQIPLNRVYENMVVLGFTCADKLRLRWAWEREFLAKQYGSDQETITERFSMDQAIAARRFMGIDQRLASEIADLIDFILVFSNDN